MGLVWRSRTSLVGQLIGLVRLVASFAAQLFYRPSDAVAEEYHKWYYGNLVWTKTTYMGINCWKSVSDMWNYQEILSELQTIPRHRVRHPLRLEPPSTSTSSKSPQV